MPNLALGYIKQWVVAIWAKVKDFAEPTEPESISSCTPFV